MQSALVCGAGGFIGHHLVRKLKSEGYWVRGVDLHHPFFSPSDADDFLLLDLRDPTSCREALSLHAQAGQRFDEVYQLAADMGGMGFIGSAECEIMRHSALINIHMIDLASQFGIGRYFFSSSACVYHDQGHGDPFISEEDAYPAFPDNEYGWEKLYAERMALAYGRRHGTRIRIARFQNCYGPEGTWRGGREKAPAALSRKIALVPDGGEIDVWGDGTAMRSYTFVDDMVRGIFMLMHSDVQVPINIGSEDFISVNDLVAVIARVAGKRITTRHVAGPVGVQARNHRFEKIRTLGWRADFSVEDGIRRTYPWVRAQVEAALATGMDIDAVEDVPQLTMSKAKA